jgi:outer membrane protein assembly factor BamB
MVFVEDNSAGTVYALNSKTGALIWEVRPFYNTFNSFPTIANGTLYVVGNANNDTTLIAMDPPTGKTLWSTTLGPSDYNATAATVGSDAVYLVANQTVYAVNAHSGRELWTYSLGAIQGCCPAPPSFSNGVVFVGSLDDNVYALDAITGELIWKYATKGSISSAPAVANGLVYVGSADHYVYALNANTGALVWTYLTLSEIYSSVVLANGVAFCISTDNFLYAWDAFNGGLLWKYGFGYASTSPPAVANGAVWASEIITVYAFRLSPSDSTGDSVSDIPPAMETLHADLSLEPRK